MSELTSKESDICVRCGCTRKQHEGIIGCGEFLRPVSAETFAEADRAMREVLLALCDVASDFGGHIPADHARTLLAKVGLTVEPVTQSAPEPPCEHDFELASDALYVKVQCAKCEKVDYCTDTVSEDHVCGVCEGTQRGTCNCTTQPPEVVDTGTIANPTNRYLFKYVCQLAGIELGEDRVDEALGKVRILVRDARRYRHLRTSRLLPDVLGHELDAAVDVAMLACSTATKEGDAHGSR